VRQLAREAAGRYIGLYPYQRKKLFTKKTVVIVDSSQQISTQDMGKLLKRCDRAGAKVILVGSADSLQSIERGAPFAYIGRELPAAELTEVVRPKRREDARNLGRVPAGKAKEVVQDLAQRDLLHVADSRDLAVAKLLSDWQRAGGRDNPRDHLIIAPDADQAKRFNQQASEVRRGTSKNATDGNKNDSVILPSGEKVFVGDRILCTRTARRYGVLSGSLGTLVGVSRRLDAVQVELDDSHRVTLPLSTYPHITRGYAVTVWQAPPTRHAYLLLGSMFGDNYPFPLAAIVFPQCRRWGGRPARPPKVSRGRGS